MSSVIALTKMKMKALLWVCVLSVSLLLGYYLAYRDHPPAPTTQENEDEADFTPERMPSFLLEDLEGRQISSAQFAGKVLIIDFWATWCAPCEKEMPDFQALYDKYRDQGFEMIGIAQDPDRRDVKKFVKRLGVRYTILMSTNKVEIDFGGIIGLPTAFIIDREGHIREKIVGFEYPAYFEAKLKALL